MTRRFSALLPAVFLWAALLLLAAGVRPGLAEDLLEQEAQSLTPSNEEVLQAPAPAPDADAEEAPPEDEAPEPILAMDPLQKRILYARLLVQTGQARQGLAEYRALIRENPGRDDILSSYARALLDLGRLDEARGVILPWLARKPDDQDALRMAAELAMAAGQPSEASVYFEHLSRLRPRDAAALSDAAYARQEAGDELQALRLFSESLDVDPNQPEARQAVRDALLARRPRITGAAGVLKQDGDTYTYAGGFGASAQVLARTRLEVLYDHVTVTRPFDDGTPALDNDLDHVRARVRQQIFKDLDLRVGAGGFTGFKSGSSQEIGLDWRALDWGVFRLDGKRNQPWYDEPSATEYRGSYNDAVANFDGFTDGWGLYGEAGVRRYYLSPVTLYGTKYRFNAVVTRQLFTAPETYVSYSYYRTHFHYRDPDYHPLEMVKNEALHMFTASVAASPLPWLRTVLSGGVGKDEFKPRPTYVFSPSLEMSIGPRVDVTAGFEYRSESDRIGGGETMSANLGLSIVF